jgi:hypothetical protein
MVRECFLLRKKSLVLGWFLFSLLFLCERGSEAQQRSLVVELYLFYTDWYVLLVEIYWPRCFGRTDHGQKQKPGARQFFG